MPDLSAAALSTLGSGLHRPECVVIGPDGSVVVSDWRGGVTIIPLDGRPQRSCLAAGLPLKPNGLVAPAGGAFVLAHLGDHDGGVFRLTRDGAVTPLIVEISGRPVPPTNHVTVDALGRIWFSVSTRHDPRQRAWTPSVADGFIAIADSSGTRIVAEGLHYTNEVRPDPSGELLYAVETFGRRLVRFPLRRDGSLGTGETVARFGHGCWPDGFAFDTDGGVWVTSLISNRLLRVGAGGRVDVILEDLNPDFVEEAERAFAAGALEKRHLGPIAGTRLQQVTSIAFGGEKGATAFLGSLHGDTVFCFDAGVRGVPPAWPEPGQPPTSHS